MVLIPDDPTKAQAWLRGVGTPNMELDLYIPRGNKGDPGGFTAATSLGAANLDEIRTPGLYRQDSAANVTGALNYPSVSSGVLEVLQSQAATELIQRFTPHGGASAIGRNLFIRRYQGGAWTAWTIYMSARMDQSAGRSMYVWDYLNNRDQLVYGDTGLRGVTADIQSGTANLISLRRVGLVVQFRLVTWAKGADPQTATDVIYTAPVGFRPDTTLYSAPGVQRGTANRCDFDIGMNGTVVQRTPSLTTGLQLNATWITNDPWPTTLPGVSLGTIPNL